MVSVFLSYAHEDTVFVNKLVVHLMRLGYNVIQDTKTFKPGSNIRSTIENSIHKADCFVPVLTGNAIQSEWVRKLKIGLASRLRSAGRSLRVVPILVDRNDASLRPLRDILCIDFSEDYGLALAQLVRALPRIDFDELHNLRQELDGVPFGEYTLLSLLKEASKERVSWKPGPAEDLINAIEPLLSEWDDLDTAYWWLIVYGVLRFTQIDEFWDGDEYYEDSMEFAEIAPRGVALLNGCEPRCDAEIGRRVL